ncbi:MAG: hypothetical protein Q8R26_03270 [bacterium]|nr:hypothetical protein [bacterium]
MSKLFLTTAVISILLVSATSVIFADTIIPPSGQGGSTIIPPSGGSRSNVVTIPNPLGVNSIAALIDRIATWLLLIGAPILTLMIIIGAFQILIAGGKPENIIKGRHTITYAVVGYALLLLSTGVTSIIKSVLGN